jgi:ubiquinone/menaquinone biosynthesis C-methylase UbiE
MDELEFTGERLVPGKSPPELEAEHRARYEFAKKFVEGLRVLDLGCGEGYGSNMLSEVAQSVVGIDRSTQAMNRAKGIYRAVNLTFVPGDVTALPFKPGQFDACVCFEVIEHILDPKELLRQVNRVLGPEGVFVASTPNRSVKVSSRPNPYHVKEYTVREFRNMLTAYLRGGDVQLYGQFVRGKTYSRIMRDLKNMYLAAKGAMGISPAGELPEKAVFGHTLRFDFRTDMVDLAEYIIAVVALSRRNG